jgi:hypothetical protein
MEATVTWCDWVRLKACKTAYGQPEATNDRRYLARSPFMPTVQQWQQALARPYNLRVESSDALCQEVTAAQQRHNARRTPPVACKAVTPWPAAETQPILFRPI